MAPPFREVEFDILYGQGISRAGDVLDLASEASIIERSGAWFSFQNDRIGQGRDNARTYLEQHPDMLDRIEDLLLAKHGISRRTAPSDERPAGKSPPNDERTTAGKSAPNDERTTATSKAAAANSPSVARAVSKGPAN
jgi:recombination protein RecA